MTAPLVRNVIAVVEDLSIGTSKLAAAAVTTPKIADGAVTGEKLADGAVDADQLATGAVGRDAMSAALTLWSQGLPLRAPVVVVTTTDISITGGAPSTYDGVTLQQGDRVLLVGQTSHVQDGLRRVSILGTGANGTWVRTDDANTDGDLFEGVSVYVASGTAGAGKTYRLDTAGVIEIDVDTQSWSEIVYGISGAASDAAIAAALAAHVAASDPHTQYQKESEKASASGYASLDSSVLVPRAQLGTGSPGNTNWLRGDGVWAAPTAVLVGADPTGTAAGLDASLKPTEPLWTFGGGEVVEWMEVTPGQSSQTKGAGIVMYQAHLEERGHTYDAMQFRVTAVAQHVKLALYAVTSGKPAARLWLGTAIDLTAGGDFTALFASGGTWDAAGASYKDGSDRLVLAKGAYLARAWIVEGNVAFTTVAALRTLGRDSTNFANGSAFYGWTQSITYASGPPTSATPVGLTSGAMPFMSLRKV